MEFFFSGYGDLVTYETSDVHRRWNQYLQRKWSDGVWRDAMRRYGARWCETRKTQVIQSSLPSTKTQKTVVPVSLSWVMKLHRLVWGPRRRNIQCTGKLPVNCQNGPYKIPQRFDQTVDLVHKCASITVHRFVKLEFKRWTEKMVQLSRVGYGMESLVEGNHDLLSIGEAAVPHSSKKKRLRCSELFDRLRPTNVAWRTGIYICRWAHDTLNTF